MQSTEATQPKDDHKCHCNERCTDKDDCGCCKCCKKCQHCDHERCCCCCRCSTPLPSRIGNRPFKYPNLRPSQIDCKSAEKAKHEVYVVMAGLHALAERQACDGHSQPRYTPCEPQLTYKKDHVALFVRHQDFQMSGTVYGLPVYSSAQRKQAHRLLGESEERSIAFRNHRHYLRWYVPKKGTQHLNPDTDCAPCCAVKNAEDRYRWIYSDLKKQVPETQYEARNMYWLPKLEHVFEDKVAFNDYAVDKPPILREVGAQLVLDQGEHSVGHLVQDGRLVPAISYPGSHTKDVPSSNAECRDRASADVLVLRLAPPPGATHLVLHSMLLPCLAGEGSCNYFELNPERPLVVSLTNLARPVGEVSDEAHHLRKLIPLLVDHQGAPFDPDYFDNPRVKDTLQYTTIQPGFDFDGIEGVTPPSVQNRDKCPGVGG